MNAPSKIYSLVICAFVLLVSCQSSSPSQVRDPLEKSYQHIDRGEYDLAIEELTTLSRTDSRPEVLVTLASAYAARGGIKVEQYWGFVIGFRSPLLSEPDLRLNPTVAQLKKVTEQATDKVSAKDLEALSDVVRIMTLWELYKDRVEAIPVVTGSANSDVTLAIDVLSQVQTPGGRLYRAILDLILFKSYILSTEKPWNGFAAVIENTVHGDSQSLCEFDFVKFTTWLRPISTRMVETLEDLTIAFPEQIATLRPAQVQIQQLDQSVLKARSELRQKKGCSQ